MREDKNVFEGETAFEDIEHIEVEELTYDRRSTVNQGRSGKDKGRI